MLESVERVPWHTYQQPSSDQGAVPRALRALAFASVPEDAYGALLNAVGRDHAGTYYPVVVPAMDFIGEIAEQGGDHARRYALEALIDLVWSFEPEPGFEKIDDGSGGEVGLRAAVREAGARLIPMIRHAAVRPDNEPVAQKIARDLLDLLAT